MLVVVDTDNLLTPAMLAHYERRACRTYVRRTLTALGIAIPEPLKIRPLGISQAESRRKAGIIPPPKIRGPRGRPRGAQPSRMTLWRDRKKAEVLAAAANACL